MQYLRVDPAQMMKEQAKTFDAKKWVWVPVAGTDGYGAAMVKSASGDLVTVETQGGKVRKNFCSCSLRVTSFLRLWKKIENQ